MTTFQIIQLGLMYTTIGMFGFQMRRWNDQWWDNQWLRALGVDPR